MTKRLRKPARIHNMSTSNWEEAKARSNYHFNKWHTDTDCVQHLGRFTGGWQTELQAVIEEAKP